MEKYSTWRDPATGVAPFLIPLSPTSANLPLPVKAFIYPLGWLLATVRTFLIVLILLVHFLLIEILLKVLAVIPPVYHLFSKVVTVLLARISLLLLGYCWISAEYVTLKRSVRAPTPPPFSPQRGDLIVANYSSYVEVLYLAFRYNVQFIIPVSSTGSKSSSSSSAKITSWRRVSLLYMIKQTGYGPERSEAGESLEAICKNSRNPVAIFPECTTSNNRALLKFGQLHIESTTSTNSIKTYIISFKHDLPTPATPSATQPIPHSSYNPIPHIFSVTTSPSPRTLQIRKLNPSESPKLSASPKSSEMDDLSSSMTACGRWKKTGLGWEEKEEFLKFRAKRS